MSDEGLEEVWHTLLSIIVPNLQQVVLSSSQHVPAIRRQVSAGDGSLMHSGEFAQVGTLEGGQAVHLDFLVLCHDNDLAIALRELEATDDLPYNDLMLQNDRVRTVNHDACTILSHDTKQ